MSTTQHVPATAATVHGVFRDRLEAEPDTAFVRCGGDWITFAELDERTDRLAAGLGRLGIGRGDMVATILPNRIETVDVMIAAAKLGAVQVPLNYYLKGDFLAYQLDDCNARVLIADAAGHEAAAGLLGATGIEHVVLVDDPPAGTTAYADLLDERQRFDPDTGPDDLIAIMYTSGTTAVAKGCMLSSGYYVAVGRAYGERRWVIPGDRMHTGFPMFHTSGQMVAFMSALVNGATINIAPEFHASTFMAEAAAADATMLVGVGVMGNMLLAQPPRPDDAGHPFRLAVWVPMAEAQQQAFEDRFATPVMSEGYGQTECVPITNSHVDGPRARSTSGTPSPLLEVRILDEADREVPLGEAGEIVVRPKVPNAMYKGYWRKPETTVTTWSTLWHHTGDYGRMDTDGFVTFVDRKKDIIRRRGENVSSLALEAVIREHPAVQDVAVSPVPAALGDEDIKASLVLAPDAGLQPQELFDFLSDRVPYFSMPRYVDLREDLPVNALSRVMKHVLKDEGVTDAMWDLEALGLVIAKRDRRGSGLVVTDVLIERHDAVMLITLNRPAHHNAIGGTMMRDLAAAFDEAAADDAVRVVVTTGAGNTFCVGADAADLADMAGVPARELLASEHVGGEKGLPPLSPGQIGLDELGNAGRWALRMWHLEKPTIAALNGSAVGGGFGIALLHDILLSARPARLGPGFAPLGLAPELGISALLPRAVGAAVSAELLYSGRLLQAEEALRLGLVTDVVDAADLLTRAMELAGTIASMPPLGVQHSKRLLRRATGTDLEAQLREEYHAQTVLFDHPDTRAAMAALTAKLAGRSTRSSSQAEGT